jgi:hypothetical protein
MQGAKQFIRSQNLNALCPANLSANLSAKALCDGGSFMRRRKDPAARLPEKNNSAS